LIGAKSVAEVLILMPGEAACLTLACEVIAAHVQLCASSPHTPSSASRRWRAVAGRKAREP
jgi:hypothetical protein